MNILDRVHTTPPSDLQVAIFNESPYVLRDYDFNRGDQRKHDFKAAVELARHQQAVPLARQRIDVLQEDEAVPLPLLGRQVPHPLPALAHLPRSPVRAGTRTKRKATSTRRRRSNRWRPGGHGDPGRFSPVALRPRLSAGLL